MVCGALASMAETPCPAVGSGVGTRLETVVSTAWVPVVEAAHSAGCSASYVRRLARSGRVRAQRVGARAWLIDVESLARVLGRESRP